MGPIADILSALSILTASIYGFALLTKPASGPRTAVKVISVVAIAGVSLVMGGPWLLTLPLLLSAVGDGFLAQDPDRWLPYGLGAFLLAHVFYIALFAHQGLGLTPFLADPARWVPALAVVATAVFTLRFIWSSLSRLREAVAIYGAVIVIMVVMAFTLPWTRSAAMIGAVLFMVSDGILAVRLFRAGGPNITADLAVWWFYWAAQALIARAFLHAT